MASNGNRPPGEIRAQGVSEAVPRDDPESSRLLAAQADLLDRYLHHLQRHESGICETMLREHPELRALAGCFDRLQALAPHAPIPAAPCGGTPCTTISPAVGPSAAAGAAGGAAATGSDSGPSFPREFGRFELLEEIGRGGMGIVYKARQRDLNRVVALKMVRASQFASAEEIRRFYHEARSAGRLRHPNIVPIHEVGEIAGQHYFTMDYIEGESLARILEAGPLDPETAAQCLLEVARAVDFLHGEGLIHRDLKPSNILVDDRGVPYVTDFGLVRSIDADLGQTHSGAVVGTPSYMPPEQACGDRARVSPRSDVYSLGAILYELLTGRPPFREETPLDTLVQVLEGEPTLPTRLNPVIPKELEWICLRCLEKAPENRYATAADLARDLERYLRGDATEARPSGGWARLRRWMRREPAFASRLAALCSAALIVQLRYTLIPGDPVYHGKVMGLIALWGVLTFAMHRLLQVERLAPAARIIAILQEPILLTVLLSIADGPLGSLFIGYPALVVGSGLWFRVSYVALMTAECAALYLLLLRIRPDQWGPVHYPFLFVILLVMLGFMVGHQVQRVRVLSRFFERRLDSRRGSSTAPRALAP